LSAASGHHASNFVPADPRAADVTSKPESVILKETLAKVISSKGNDSRSDQPETDGNGPSIARNREGQLIVRRRFGARNSARRPQISIGKLIKLTGSISVTHSEWRGQRVSLI
jgi:hypothetical protein